MDRRKAKVEVTTEVFGKPNILIRNDPNFQSGDLEAEGDFDDLMERQMQETMKPAEIQKYLNRAEGVDALTTLTSELQRTQITSPLATVTSRAGGKATRPSTGHDYRLIEKIDSAGHRSSYLNRTKDDNKIKLKKVMNGMAAVKDLCYLQVKGRSQLAKEIEETKDLESKVIDLGALHRNEVTQEIEGEERTVPASNKDDAPGKGQQLSGAGEPQTRSPGPDASRKRLRGNPKKASLARSPSVASDNSRTASARGVQAAQGRPRSAPPTPITGRWLIL